MKTSLLTLLLAASAAAAAAQTKLNRPLKHELDSLYEVDQRYRRMLFSPRLRRNPDSLAAALGVPAARLDAAIQANMIAADARNLRRVRAIVRQYGYPGKTLVGEPTNQTAWSVIQHSEEIPRYLPLIRQAAQRGELPFTCYALMLDRQLVAEGKAQRYGSQGVGYNGHPPFIWPIEQPALVNQRRKQAGFPDSIEAYAAGLGIPYRVMSLAKARQIRAQALRPHH